MLCKRALRAFISRENSNGLDSINSVSLDPPIGLHKRLDGRNRFHRFQNELQERGVRPFQQLASRVTVAKLGAIIAFK